MWSFWFFCTVWDNQIWLRAKGSHWRHKFVSLASPLNQSYWLPDLLREASEFPSIQARGGISRLAHGASLLPSASSKLCSALGYLACLHGSTMDFSQEGMREKRGPSTSMHQAGSNPAADATRMLCFSSGISKVVAVHSNATAQSYAKALAEFSISSTS